MVESVVPRTGENPITMDPATAPGTQLHVQPDQRRRVHDRQRPAVRLPMFFGRNCDGQPGCKAGHGQPCTVGEDGCEEGLECVPESGGGRCAAPCGGGGLDPCACAEDDPLCRNGDNMFDPNYRYAHRTNPGTRLLSVLRLAENNGVVGSTCAVQLDDPTAVDYGFTPALSSAITERLKVSLREHLCLDRSLVPDADGRVECVLLEELEPEDDMCPPCPASRPEPGPTHETARSALFGKETRCLCVIPQAAVGPDMNACRTYLDEPVVSTFGQQVNGWCFVDAVSSPPVGAPELTAGCPSDRRRALRLTGNARQVEGSQLYLYCD